MHRDPAPGPLRENRPGAPSTCTDHRRSPLLSRAADVARLLLLRRSPGRHQGPLARATRIGTGFRLARLATAQEGRRRPWRAPRDRLRPLAALSPDAGPPAQRQVARGSRVPPGPGVRDLGATAQAHDPGHLTAGRPSSGERGLPFAPRPSLVLLAILLRGLLTHNVPPAHRRAKRGRCMPVRWPSWVFRRICGWVWVNSRGRKEGGDGDGAGSAGWSNGDLGTTRMWPPEWPVPRETVTRWQTAT